MISGTAELAVDPLALEFTRTQLANGLVVILHEDTTAPEISLSVCYRVGASDEGAGESGSAHLFEHLMFTGSANVPGGFGARLTEAGATRVNAYTTPDHTCFFETFPPGMLDYVLYAEADRMGSFRDHLQGEALAQQQAIVLEEKAQREGAPLGRLIETMNRGVFPPGHPYRHTVIGSVSDVDGMTLAGARDWHRRFYAPDNAVIVVAGPIDAEVVLASVQAHFRHIAPMGIDMNIDVWIPAMPMRRRDRMNAAVGHGGLLYMVWPVAEASDPARQQLELLAALLAGHEFAPLHLGMVRPGHALAISAGVTPGALCSQFSITAVLDTAADHRRIEEDVRAVIARTLCEPVDQEALDRLRAGRRAGLTLSLADLNAKVSLMIEGEMLSRNPARFRDELAELDATPADHFVVTGRRWLETAPFVLEVHPQSDFAAPVTTGRPPMPNVEKTIQKAENPVFESLMLPSGLRLITAPRPGARDFLIRLELARGSACESVKERGIGMLVAAMPYHGIGDRDATTLRGLTEAAGIQLTMGSTVATFSVQLGGPAAAAQVAAELLADLVLRPHFDADILAERKREQINGVRLTDSDPMAHIGRLPIELLYGADSVEARSPQGNAASIDNINVADLLGHHKRLFAPAGATLLVVGDPTAILSINAALAVLRSDWLASANPPSSFECPAIPTREQERLHYFAAGPADQAIVTLALLLPIAKNSCEDAAARALAGVLQRRLNERLREELRWTYGVGVRTIEAEVPGLPSRLEVQAAINANHVPDAVSEIRSAVLGLSDATPPSESELEEYRVQARSNLNASVAHSGGIAAAIMGEVRDHLPISLADRIAQLDTLDTDIVEAVARRALAAGPIEWIIASSAPNVASALASANLDMVVIGLAKT